MLPALPKPDYVNESDEKYYGPIPVGKMAEKYFEWVGEVSVGELVRDFLGFVLSECSVVDEESNLDVKVRGPGDAEMRWKWGDQE